MMEMTMSARSALGSVPVPLPRPSVRGLLQALAAADARHRQGLHLRQLDDRMLRDIGVSRADVAAELRRVPTW
jgi:uncharacterized protein YjiS (DUF1127 family)